MSNIIMTSDKLKLETTYPDGIDSQTFQMTLVVNCMSFDAKLYMDGDRWCCLVGENIQSGMVGFGIRPSIAIQDCTKEIAFSY